MRRLERRNDSFQATELAETAQRIFVGDGNVHRATGVLEMRVLGPHTGIVETGRDRVRWMNLSALVLKQVAQTSV